MRYRMLSPTGDYTFGQGQADFLINSPAAVAQSVSTRLKLWLGTWFLDVTIGTPWLTQIIGKNTKSLYDTAIRTVVLQTTGVTGIVAYNSVLNDAARSLAVTMTINTQYGQAEALTVVL